MLTSRRERILECEQFRRETKAIQRAREPGGGLDESPESELDEDWFHSSQDSNFCEDDFDFDYRSQPGPTRDTVPFNNFQDLFQDADDTDQEDTDQEDVEEQIDENSQEFLLLTTTVYMQTRRNKLYRDRSSLLHDAAEHMRKGEGGEVDLAHSTELCARVLSLEMDKPAAEFAEHSTFRSALATLRGLADRLEKGDGGHVDLARLARSAELCAAVLSLEVDNAAADFASERSTFGRAMATLLSLAAAGVPEAAEALPRILRAVDEKAKQREEDMYVCVCVYISLSIYIYMYMCIYNL